MVGAVDAGLSVAEGMETGREAATLEMPKPSLPFSDSVEVGSAGLKGPSWRC